MKKAIVFLVIVSLVASLFAQAASESAADSKKVDTLSITFVPSRDTDDIVVATKPLE